ncbi:MAG: hypothetical protein Q4E65_04850 [Clostridia bacterium]|nr:hypothetical protein [Clostridia bacterium]
MEQDKRFTSPVYAKIKAEKAKTLEAAQKARGPRTPLEFLTSAFDVVGFVLYYALFLAIAYAPLLFLGFPWWANILIVIGILVVPYVGSLAELILWVWAFMLVVHLPVGFKVVLFYIGAVFYVFFVLIPNIYHLFVFE